MEQIEQKGANIKNLKESWVDTTPPHGKFMFTLFAGISEFERDLISQQTKGGLASARARGRKGGRPRTPSKTIDLALKMYENIQFPRFLMLQMLVEQACTDILITRSQQKTKTYWSV